MKNKQIIIHMLVSLTIILIAIHMFIKDIYGDYWADEIAETFFLAFVVCVFIYISSCIVKLSFGKNNDDENKKNES